jgi:hypothetical protein
MEQRAMMFPSTAGPISQSRLYDVLTDPTLYETKRTISAVQEPILLWLEEQTQRQYVDMRNMMLKLPL